MKLYEPFQFLTTAECDAIIQYAGKSEIQEGTTLRKGNIRNNRVCWYNDSTHWAEWIAMFNEIDPVIRPVA